jgi:post-segregation antitoxin (ccd killing protein)
LFHGNVNPRNLATRWRARLKPWASLENVSKSNGIFITAYKVNHIGIPLAKYETVSAKIPVELKEKAKKLGIKTGELIRKTLEAEVKRMEIEEINTELERLKPVLDKISTEEVVEMIREDRERR